MKDSVLAEYVDSEGVNCIVNLKNAVWRYIFWLEGYRCETAEYMVYVTVSLASL